ncbi:MAG: helix-turn-helix domain-containing protein [Bacteroidales bacterium]|nr:helix-turn-helix domain-containing protein [Bacteroidales bacterium]
MKGKVCVHQVVRMLCLASLPLLFLSDFLVSGLPGPERLCTDVFCALLLLMLYPVSREPVHPSLAFVGGTLLFLLVLKVLRAPDGILVAAACMALMAFLARKTVEKYREVTLLFHVTAIWANVEDYIYLLHVALTLCAGLLMLVLPSWLKELMWGYLAALVVLFGVEYYRVRTRSTVFLGRKKEEEIKRGQKNAVIKMPIQYVDSDSRSATLFNDVVRVMETKKPYLQDDFSIDDLARMTHTNRMYLSKAINFHSGRNFNQLVNFYRVRYAQEVMRKDPGLKMAELSQMCGFHTIVSFNMAFKLNERITPSEYLRSLKKLT